MFNCKFVECTTHEEWDRGMLDHSINHAPGFYRAAFADIDAAEEAARRFANERKTGIAVESFNDDPNCRTDDGLYLDANEAKYICSYVPQGAS